jgi:hypothetical protein
MAPFRKSPNPNKYSDDLSGFVLAAARQNLTNSLTICQVDATLCLLDVQQRFPLRMT